MASLKRSGGKSDARPNTRPPPPQRLPLASADVAQERIQALRRIAPDCFSEGILDCEKLRKTIGQAPNSGDEKYAFSWAGRNAVYTTIQRTSRGTLVPITKDSVDFESTENIFVEGDNLEVLKILQKSYFEKIKMIYIDPPYNKGSDAVYRDSFVEEKEAYWEMIGKKRRGVKLSTNMKTDGRFHSVWLSFIFPRLFLARNLLRDDGVIFVSIGDDEVHNLRLIMDEIFGAENFVASFVWEGGRKNDSKFVSASHDYILCYANDYALLRANNTTWRLRKDGLDVIYDKVKDLENQHGKNYGKITEELQTWYSSLDKKDPAWSHKHYNHVDEYGVFFGGDISWPGGGGPNYTIHHPTTKKPVKIPGRGWVYSKKEKMIQQIEDGMIQFGDDETSVPKLKRYLHETEDQVLGSVFYKDRRHAHQQLENLMGKAVFDNPKDPEILQDLIRATTGKDDIVMDFFAGSGSTAHAVLDQNAEDGQKRRFFCVQIEEATPDGSEARNNGYRAISDITKERLRRAVGKIKRERRLAESADLGFKAFRLSGSNFRSWERHAKDADKLRKQVELFKSTLKAGSDPVSVIYECILREGMSLNSRIEKASTKPNAVYKVTDGRRSFYVTLDGSMDSETPGRLGLGRDDTLICMDSALDDSQKTNISAACRLKTV